MSQRRLPAVWMRGGTSKGLFLHARALPPAGAQRNRLLARLLGSPDPCANQMDGLGGATSSTSKVVVIAPSARDDCDVDYWFGHVDIASGHVDASGNCGNLSAAVGPFAIDEALVPARKPITTVRIWQANLGRRILAQVPVHNGEAATAGDFRMDGVAFAGAAIELHFQGGEQSILPTGRVIDALPDGDGGLVEATLVNAGNPAVFVRAADLGLTATQTPGHINADAPLLARLQALREQATVRMGLADSLAEARRRRPATPKTHWLGPPRSHSLANGATLDADAIDLCARALSMGRAHHAYPGTSAIATAVAAALPGSVAQQMLSRSVAGALRIGHAAGRIDVAADVAQDDDGQWRMREVRLARSARRLMRGEVFIPPASV